MQTVLYKYRAPDRGGIVPLLFRISRAYYLQGTYRGFTGGDGTASAVLGPKLRV